MISQRVVDASEQLMLKIIAGASQFFVSAEDFNALLIGPPEPVPAASVAEGKRSLGN
jgi:hypothetical protein